MGLCDGARSGKLLLCGSSLQLLAGGGGKEEGSGSEVAKEGEHEGGSGSEVVKEGKHEGGRLEVNESTLQDHCENY